MSPRIAPLWIAALLCAGCSTGSRARACDPVQQTGCASGRCALGSDGAPACVGTAGELPEGAACDAPDVCADGLGCVRVAGVARCLRFCATAGASEECQATSSADPFAAEVRAGAVCSVAVPDRTDLGACVLPCRPGAGDCPDGARCGLAEAVGTLTCVPRGNLSAGAGCGGTLESCDQGLVCAPLGAGRVCAPLILDPDNCAVGTTAEALPVASEGWACVPCEDLGPSLSGGRAGVCLGERALVGDTACAGVSELLCGCAPFGQLARPAGDAVGWGRRLAQSAASVAWVDARLDDAGWVWGDGTPVADGDWAEGEPGAGGCAVVGAEGLASDDCAAVHAFACETVAD